MMRRIASLSNILTHHPVGRISLYKVTTDTENLNKVLQPYVAAYVDPVAACGAFGLNCQDGYEREHSVNGI